MRGRGSREGAPRRAARPPKTCVLLRRWQGGRQTRARRRALGAQAQETGGEGGQQAAPRGDSACVRSTKERKRREGERCETEWVVVVCKVWRSSASQTKGQKGKVEGRNTRGSKLARPVQKGTARAHSKAQRRQQSKAAAGRATLWQQRRGWRRSALGLGGQGGGGRWAPQRRRKGTSREGSFFFVWGQKRPGGRGAVCVEEETQTRAGNRERERVSTNDGTQESRERAGRTAPQRSQQRRRRPQRRADGAGASGRGGS